MTVPVLARGCSCGWSSGDCTCARNRPPLVKPLSEFTDQEIAWEYHQRMLGKFDDPMKRITIRPLAPWTDKAGL